MSTAAIIVIVFAITVIAIALLWFLQKRRSGRLHTKFGPEYERTLAEYGDRRKAESELESREKRIEKYEIRGLTREERERFAESWKSVQARFVDEPQQAVTGAHKLLNEVMRTRGYPVSAEFEENAATLSVEHPRVVEHYRLACDIAKRQERGRANTEELRQAMVSYRVLFEDLLGVPVNQPVRQPDEVRR
jgi:hypothetical protein